MPFFFAVSAFSVASAHPTKIDPITNNMNRTRITQPQKPTIYSQVQSTYLSTPRVKA